MIHMERANSRMIAKIIQPSMRVIACYVISANQSWEEREKEIKYEWMVGAVGKGQVRMKYYAGYRKHEILWR